MGIGAVVTTRLNVVVIPFKDPEIVIGCVPAGVCALVLTVMDEVQVGLIDGEQLAGEKFADARNGNPLAEKETLGVGEPTPAVFVTVNVLPPEDPATADMPPFVESVYAKVSLTTTVSVISDWPDWRQAK